MKKINIQNEANIKAEGNLNSGNCKPVICLDTGDVFTSCIDAAESIGVHFSAMSAHLRGKTRTIHGKRYMYLSRVSEGLDAITTRLREASAMESDAKKWRDHQAKIDAARKEEERRQQAIAKAEAKVASLNEARTKYENKLSETMVALEAAQIELASLRDNNNSEAA
jgi:septal ring factor EnvC (AmiA/AmiB activator)